MDEIIMEESNGFDDWDLNDPEETPAPEPEEPEAEETEAPETEEPEETQEEQPAETPTAEEAPEAFELTFLGEKRSVNRDEVITLAQKGMNYDHAVAQANDKLKEYEDFFKELSPNEKIEDVMDGVLARLKAQREGIDEGVALQRVKLDRERKALEKQQSSVAQAKQQDEARQESFRRFAQQYPDVDVKDIPKEIWGKVAQGGDLVSLYAEHENKQLKQELKALQDKVSAMEQNSKNKSRSTGSVTTAGKAQEKDDFDSVWDDD